MNFDGKNPARYISITQFKVSSKLIFLRKLIKRNKLMLPGKRFGITISLRDDGDEDEAL